MLFIEITGSNWIAKKVYIVGKYPRAVIAIREGSIVSMKTVFKDKDPIRYKAIRDTLQDGVTIVYNGEVYTGHSIERDMFRQVDLLVSDLVLRQLILKNRRFLPFETASTIQDVIHKRLPRFAKYRRDRTTEKLM